MGVSLAGLVEVVKAALVEDVNAALVAARDGVPSAAQYERAVRDAVADYGRRNAMQGITTLSIVSGTASYDLPSDFVKVIRLESVTNVDGVIISDEGLVPVSATYEERWMVQGLTMTFWPTPTYTLSRDLWYVARHVLDTDAEYPNMTEEDAGVLMLKAQVLALTLQANAVAGNAWKYAIGDESVDKTGQVKALREQAGFLEGEYQKAVKAAVGAVGVRARYDWQGY